MSITIVSQGRDVSPWVKALKKKRPDLELYVFPDDQPREEITFALSWGHPLGMFREYPNLKCISSLGAGVDHILKDPDIPEQVQIARIKDENLTSDMANFTMALVLNHLRDLHHYKAAEETQTWKPLRYKRNAEVTVGVMGIGTLGSEVARRLSSIGLRVTGWASSAKQLEGVGVYAGQGEFDAFLATADILICLLPLTPDTTDILNKETFLKLPKGAFLINVARGEHLVEEDLLEMLETGHLSGASLDVFREEPLPESHPFWAHPRINVTPHIASVTNPESAVDQILENYDRIQNGQQPLNLVSRAKGY
ncbi:2-hydroxyacid dehydrogenase [Pontibacter flavimaris]|uniref:Glyoxylate/hydroxypyruvate reductase A n=1 Tax=Pontibacter flavimaris TaxID=1797110 RepID=A0A1Q5P9B9_9BACT|nr:glyoxylate/hydroxypyruvate reductase A [Pontibacter flavimaris]OKL38829.1 glyoxylate/hydroxypyruvate reductase A [Pontibacter flavimaris]